jgi:hypothetical protein
MSSVGNIVATAKAIHIELKRDVGPPEEGIRASTQPVILMSLVRKTRGYIERITNQVNGAYENGWYDACVVMIRRLIETLIIEAFEHHSIAGKIKNPSGDFVYLRELIDKNLGRNARQALPKLKDIGDKSAHSRRYVARVETSSRFCQRFEW